MNAEIAEKPIRVVAEIKRRDVFVVAFRYMLLARWMWALCSFGFATWSWSQWHSENRPTYWLPTVCLVAVLGAIWLALLVAAALFTAVITVVKVSPE